MFSISNHTNENSFEKLFYKDLIQSEKFRALILAVVSFILIIYVLAVFIFFKNFFPPVKGFEPPFVLLISLLLIIALRALFISKRINQIYEKYPRFYNYFRYGNSFVEVSVPTLAILIFGLQFETSISLITPPVLLYFVFILLSILELDFKICLFTGFVATAEYLGLTFYFLSYNTNQTDPMLVSTVIYLGKATIIFISGIVAGLISYQIRKRIFSTYGMVSEKNRLEKLFGQQVSPEIVEEIIKTKQEITSRRRNVCIMFIDIRDFTKFSETKSPEEIVQYQNNIFAFMIEIINKHHGIINQFMGDGFMATFGAPITKLYDCQNAFNAATEILNELERKNESGEIPHTRVGIGLHFGEAVTGNVGTAIRKQYSITGNTVILASRIEQLNKNYNSSFLISKEALQEIKTNHIVPECLGKIQVKGRSEPIEVYKVR